MTDITSLFNDILSKHGEQKPDKRPIECKSDTVDDFLQEAYKIKSQIDSLHAWLKVIRQSYLSSSRPSKLATRHRTRDGVSPPQHLTNQDREQIDINAKAMLRELNGKIRNLSTADAIRHDTRIAVIDKKHRGAFGAFGAWAAGGVIQEKSAEHTAAEEAENAVATHRNNVVFFLRERLQDCMLTQTGMMEIRIKREREKQKSILAKAGQGILLDMANTSSAGSTRQNSQLGPNDMEQSRRAYRPEDELTSEQIQMFERLNQELLQQDESTLNQVRTAEKSLGEIAELQQELINNLTMQSEHINQLVEDSLQTTENVGGGNKQLQGAAEKPSTARRIFISTTAFCAFLIVWDLAF